MKTIQVDIKRLPRAPNRSRGMPWMVAKNERDKWHKDLAVKLWSVAHKNPQTFCRVNIVRFSSRPMDDDNVAAACKPILDSLVELGFLIDDAPNVMKLTASWAHAPVGQGFTRIRMEYK